jgi:hypothetical protein
MKKTGGTWFGESTSDLLLTKEALGHRSPKPTRRYVPLNRQRMRQAMKNFFTADSDKNTLLSHSMKRPCASEAFRSAGVAVSNFPDDKVIPFQKRAVSR